MIIRFQKPCEQADIEELIKRAFLSAKETDGDEHNLYSRLCASDDFLPELSLIAEIDGKIVGHILFSKMKIGDEIALALAPLSVDPDYQGTGIGSALIIKGHEVAKELSYKASIVLGDDNYYKKFGYLEASKFEILAPFEIPSRYFMVKFFSEQTIKGDVLYPPEFNI